MTAETGPRALAVRGESTNGRVASAGGPDARRGGAGDVGAHRRADATKQTAPRRRNPKGAWVLRAIAALLVVDDAHRHRLPPRALRSPHNTHARGRLYFHHGLLDAEKVPATFREGGHEHELYDHRVSRLVRLSAENGFRHTRMTPVAFRLLVNRDRIHRFPHRGKRNQVVLHRKGKEGGDDLVE